MDSLAAGGEAPAWRAGAGAGVAGVITGCGDGGSASVWGQCGCEAWVWRGVAVWGVGP
jgi:hypothetical protein